MYRTLIAVAVVIALIGAVGWKAYTAGQVEATQRLTAVYVAEKLETQKVVNAELTKARQREKELLAVMQQSSQEYNNEIQRVTDKYDNIVDSLRNRPVTRTDSDRGVPESTSTDVGCTGKGLARPDAEFLTRYAADAAKLQAALNSCKERYSSVMDMINGQDSK
jgi:hypothetical protein